MNILHRRIGRVGFAVLWGALVVVAIPLSRLEPVPFSESADHLASIAAVVAWIVAAIIVSAWRCHDFGKSGWHDFWNNQIPIIGGLISAVELFLKPGDPHTNSYGPPPPF